MVDRTIAEKLRVKPGTTVWVSDASRANLLGTMPEGAKVTRDLVAAGTGVLFADDSASLRTQLKASEAALGIPAAFWVAYPKANRTDINRDTLWPILSEYGMRPISQIAIDETWSALRFRKLKPGEAPFTGGSKD